MNINSLVNKVVPFKFVYDEFVLEGECYKFRTTTPVYIKQLQAKIDGASTEDEKQRAGYQWLVDAVKSWNATGENDEPLPPTLETLNLLPIPFLSKFAEYLAGLRDGNFTNGASSPSGSLVSADSAVN